MKAWLPACCTIFATGRGNQMEGNELSYSEYLKCNNACVKVTINRYRGLCLGTLRELRDSLLELAEGFCRISGPDVDERSKAIYCILASGLMCLQFMRYVLNRNVLAEAVKFEGIDSSSLRVELRDIVDIKGIDQLCDFIRLLEGLDERYDQRHPNLGFCRSLKLHNLIIPLVTGAGKTLAALVLESHCAVFQRLFQFTQQDFEPEEIHHGSGFVIADRFVITNKHVIEEAMNDETLHIRILNETIDELPCVVVHCDTSNDLALLFCPGLDLKKHGICPFALSKEALWPSLSVFSFGYPLTHTEKSALFVKGHVSGVKNRYGDNRKPFWVLNCDLNAGNSGGPVLRRIDGDLKVVGVVAQKHKKDILTMEEISILEEERSTLQMNCASDSRDQFWKSMSLKMYDALNETHCQFGYGNVVPGHLVVEFLSDPSVTSIMDFLKEVRCIETKLRQRDKVLGMSYHFLSG